VVLTAATAAAALIAAGCGASSAAKQAAQAPLRHVFVIVLENHSKSDVVGDPNAPRISALARRYGQATSYYGVTHPSEPNYLAMIAGRTFGVNDDDPTRVFHARNLVDQLEAAGRSWAAYEESMPSAGFLGGAWPSAATPLYASKHNPFVHFADIRSDRARLARIKPYEALARDLNGPERSIPDFVYIVPNQCHDMHGGVDTRVAPDGRDGTPCPNGLEDDGVADASLERKADDFVGRTVRTIMSSKAWTGNSVIFLVADESGAVADASTGAEDTSGCCDTPVVPAGDPAVSVDWQGGPYGGGLAPAIVIARSGPRHVASSTPYNHYSLLATIEDGWHLGHLGHAGDVAGGVVPMDDLLGR
jgi:hypothetical protein